MGRFQLCVMGCTPGVQSESRWGSVRSGSGQDSKCLSCALGSFSLWPLLVFCVWVRALWRGCWLPLLIPPSPSPRPDWSVRGGKGGALASAALSSDPVHQPLEEYRQCSRPTAVLPTLPSATLHGTYTLVCLPHPGHPLTLSMMPTTLQPLSCSRAELSVRMGRSLRLLNPCGGGRQARVGAG